MYIYLEANEVRSVTLHIASLPEQTSNQDLLRRILLKSSHQSSDHLASIHNILHNDDIGVGDRINVVYTLNAHTAIDTVQFDKVHTDLD